MNGQLPKLTLLRTEEITPVDEKLLADMAAMVALQSPQKLTSGALIGLLVMMGNRAEHLGYLRGVKDGGRVSREAAADAIRTSGVSQ